MAVPSPVDRPAERRRQAASSRSVSRFPRNHIVVYGLDDSRSRICRSAAIRMNADRIAVAADDAVHGAAALPARGIDVVIDLSRIDGSDLVRIVPLRAARLVSRITSHIADAGQQIGV